MSGESTPEGADIRHTDQEFHGGFASARPAVIEKRGNLVISVIYGGAT